MSANMHYVQMLGCSTSDKFMITCAIFTRTSCLWEIHLGSGEGTTKAEPSLYFEMQQILYIAVFQCTYVTPI